MAIPTQVVALPARTEHRIRRPHAHPQAPLRGVPTPPPAASIGGAGRVVIRGLVLALAVLAPLAAFAGSKLVSVDDEGQVRTVQTYATSSRDLLDRLGAPAATTDLVTPGAELRDGADVTYRKAKKIRLVLDGEPRNLTARGLTVGEAIKDLGLVPGPKDHVQPAPDTKLTPGMEIFVRNAIHATVRVDGARRDVVSSADTVGNLLKHAGIALDADDYVVPKASTEPVDEMQVRVVRVRHSIETKNVRVPYRVVTHRDNTMESGSRRVEQTGVEGLKVQKYAIVTEDGRRVSSKMTEETTSRSARDHIVRVGTKEPVYSGSGAVEEGIASWYRSDGLVAAHKTLPKGTVVKVTNLENGKTVTVKITDRGPYAEGRVIDLSDDAFERLAPLGKGTVKVKVEH